MNEPLAIVGMACRLPGADGLEAFWNLVVAGRTAWGKLPESRLPRDLYFHPEKSRLGKSYSELGAVVCDRPVDPAVCPITPEMLERFDVAHTIFLEVASLACRDAGQNPFAMPADRRTGVYVGHTGGSTRIGDIVYATGIDETARFLSDVEAARELLGPETAAVADDRQSRAKVTSIVWTCSAEDNGDLAVKFSETLNVIGNVDFFDDDEWTRLACETQPRGAACREQQ